jgi:hypothetical protein
LYSSDSANAVTAMAAAAANTKAIRIRFVISFPFSRVLKRVSGVVIPGCQVARLPSCRAGVTWQLGDLATRQLLLIEVLHLVVQPVHLGVDLFLRQDSLPHQQGRQGVDENAVLDQHLLELFLELFAVSIVSGIVHRILLA